MDCGSGVGLGAFASGVVEHEDGSFHDTGIQLDMSPVHGGLLGVGGVFVVECFDKDGNPKWSDVAKNAFTNASMNDVLNVYYNSGIQSANWYLGLVDNSGFSAFAAADTMSSHAGWTENTGYSALTRPSWGQGASSSQTVTNSTQVSFAINASGTIKGLFLANNNTKGGTTGILNSTSAFSGGNQAVNNGDTLKATYTVSATTI